MKGRSSRWNTNWWNARRGKRNLSSCLIGNEYAILMKIWTCFFFQSDFIVWAVKERRPVVQVWCAGGHRSLDCIIHEGDLRVAFVQNKMVWGGSWPIEMKLRPSLQVSAASEQARKSSLFSRVIVWRLKFPGRSPSAGNKLRVPDQPGGFLEWP